MIAGAGLAHTAHAHTDGPVRWRVHGAASAVSSIALEYTKDEITDCVRIIHL
jgi:hypothetical protein